MTHQLKVVGFDPSLRNWGYSIGNLLIQNSKISLEIETSGVIQPELSKNKQTRVNSEDINRANFLFAHANQKIIDSKAKLVFVEVPVGSQSARAMASYGICVGILGAIRSVSAHFFEVTPSEVKLAVANNKTASKQEMIDQIVNWHPEINWPSNKGKITSSKAEHIADSVGAIYAGLKLPSVLQIINLMSP